MGSKPVTSVNTGVMICQLSYEATHWEQGQFIGFISSCEEWFMNCKVYMKYFIFELQ